MSKSSTPSCAVYGLGLLGALVYNIQYADGIGQFFWGLLKSLLWPAFMIYHVLEMMQL